MRESISRPGTLGRVYFALIALGGIAAHLASEFAALGRAAEGVVFSARHIYLALGAAVLLVIVVREVRTFIRSTAGPRDLTRQIHVGMERLPFGGRGLAFCALSSVLQFGIGMSTVVGEGCQFGGDDVVWGLLGALVTVIILAIIGRAVASQVPSIAIAIARLLPPATSTGTSRWVALINASAPACSMARCAPLFSRPPPQAPIQA